MHIERISHAITVSAVVSASFGCGDTGNGDEPTDGTGSASDETGTTGVGTDTGTTGAPACPADGATLGGPVIVTSSADLDRLEGVTTINGTLEITGVDADTVAQATCLEFVDGDLRILANPNLTDLGAFAGVTTVSGDLVIGENDALTTIAGFGALTEVRHFSLTKNSALVDTRGLDALIAVHNNFIIRFNDELTDIRSLRTLRQIGSAFNVVNNPKLCMTAEIAAVGDGLEMPLPPEIDYFTGNDEDC